MEDLRVPKDQRAGLEVLFGLCLIVIGFVIGHSIEKTKEFQVADPQVAQGDWDISVQIPPCPGGFKFNYPEREGDVLTIYCQNMPVRTK